jgi:hypothetical protein
MKEKKWKKETNVHHLLLRASHQDQILNADVKICLPEVVLRAVPELRAKHVMALIHVVHDLHQWIAINLVCVHVFLNLIFLKM